MKVPAVNFSNMTSCKYRSVQKREGTQQPDANNNVRFNDIPYVYPVMFTASEDLGGQSKLRKLFAYRLPCMYSGVIMIDPKELTHWMDTGLYNKPAKEVFNKLEPYKDSFSGMEEKVLELLRERSLIHPDKNIKELLSEVEPIFKRRLRKSQTPVFQELRSAAEALPVGFRYKFNDLMDVTERRLNERPIIIPFSSYEFKYRLYKINNDIQNGSDKKAKRVMNKLIKESQRFNSRTNSHTLDNQQRVLRMIDVVLRKSVLKDEPRLRELVDVSKSRLMREEIVVPFSRKQFLYDLIKVIDDLPDKELKDRMISIAEKLPTSRENFSAYVVKLCANPADKILHRIVWPYIASVEHLKPKSEGGDRHKMSNLGAARTVLNSQRQSRDFNIWINEHPEVRENCQKYVDRLIELYHEGVFTKLNIDPKYITDFKDTIYKLSNHSLDLDISGMAAA